MTIAVLLSSPHFTSVFWAWVASITEHLGVIGTGGFLVFLIQVAEKKWPHVFNWRTSRRVFLVFLLFAIFQSWQEEYLSRLGRERDLIQASTEADGLRRDIGIQARSMELQKELAVGGAVSQCVAREEVIGTLQKQNRDEQVLIAGCQTQALKLLTPAPLRVTPIFMDADNTNIQARSMRWLVLINKAFTPTHLVVECPQGVVQMMSASLTVLGGGHPGISFGGKNARLSRNAWEILTDETWSERSPLLVTIVYRGAEETACAFEPR